MSDERKSRVVAPTLAIVVVVAGLIAGYFFLSRKKGDETPARPAKSGFQERAKEGSSAARGELL